MRKRPWQFQTACIFLCVFNGVIWFQNVNEMKPVVRVIFLDVGQGNAAVILLPDRSAVLVDGGAYRQKYNTGERVVVPFLQWEGVRTLEYVIATHNDNDHIGGLSSVIENVHVEKILWNGYPSKTATGAYFENTVSAHRFKTATPKPGNSIGGAGYRLYALYPASEQSNFNAESRDQNALSICILFCFGTHRFLLTGDAPASVEHELINSGIPIQSQVLLAGHHGSRYSTSQEFLKHVQPEHVVISCGRYNRYNHPHPDVLHRIASQNIALRRTDREGAVIFRSDGKHLNGSSIFFNLF